MSDDVAVHGLRTVAVAAAIQPWFVQVGLRRAGFQPSAACGGFDVTVRPATSGTICMGSRCLARSDALEYATAHLLDVWPSSSRGVSTLSDDSRNLCRSQGLRLTQGVADVLCLDHTLTQEVNPEPLSGAARLRGSGSG